MGLAAGAASPLDFESRFRRMVVDFSFSDPVREYRRRDLRVGSRGQGAVETSGMGCFDGRAGARSFCFGVSCVFKILRPTGSLTRFYVVRHR